MTGKDIINRENFCPIPFLQLQLNPLGNVSACCFSGEYKVGDVATSTVEKIWNNEEMQKWRREFLTGDIKICKDPMRNFDCHKMYNHLKEHVVPLEIQPELPKRLDLRLNGKCNLECIMCDVWKQPNKLYDSSDFWNIGPEKIFPYLLEIDMLGGEPFIQRDTFRLIDEVTKVNSKCSWGFITNAAYKFNVKLEQTLDKIHLRHIHISLDSIRPETYAIVRKNGDLDLTLNTAEGFVRYRQKRAEKGESFALFGSMCVQKANWSEIPEFISYCRERGITPILQSVIGRDHLSLRELSNDQMLSILRGLQPFMESDEKFTVLPVHEEVSRLLGEREAVL